MKDRMIPLLVIMATATALVLNSQGKLLSADATKPGVANILFSPDGYTLGDVRSVSTFAMAFFAYILVVSVMDDKQAEWLTLVIVLGALMYNQKTAGSGSVLSTFFTPGTASSADPFAGATGTATGSIPGNGTPGVFDPFGGGNGISITPTGG